MLRSRRASGRMGCRLVGGSLAPIFELIFLVLFLLSLALVLVSFVDMIDQSIRRSRRSYRSVASFGLLLLAIPCSFSFWTAVDVGWRQLESEIGLTRLGVECVSLLESPAGRLSGNVPEPLLNTPAMRRLRTSQVRVSENCLRIELPGGLDHGYVLNRNLSNQRWEAG